MLRLLVLLLALANGGYWAWSQGALAGFGFAPTAQREPQRLAQQIRPELARLLSAQDVRRMEAAPVVATPPPRPPECLMAGLFDERQLAPLRAALSTNLPTGTWQLESAVDPARWMIYMGKYPNAEALTRKKIELRQLNIAFEDVANAALQPGLSLGSFTDPALANQELAALTQKGVRTARVVPQSAAQRGQLLRLPSVDDAFKSKLEALKPLLLGRAVRACG
jgi:hypothetical protein